MRHLTVLQTFCPYAMYCKVIIMRVGETIYIVKFSEILLVYFNHSRPNS